MGLGSLQRSENFVVKKREKFSYCERFTQEWTAAVPVAIILIAISPTNYVGLLVKKRVWGLGIGSYRKELQ